MPMFYVLCLVGCISTSPGIPDLYIVSLTGSKSQDTSELRVGYLGICIKLHSDMPDSRACHPSIGSSEKDLQRQLFPLGDGGASEVRQLLDVGLALQSKLLLPILAGTGPAFMAGVACLFVLLRKVKSNLGQSPPGIIRLRRCAICLLWLSTTGSLASALATTMTTAALEYSLTDLHSATFEVNRGLPIIGLQWTLALLSTLLSGMAWFAVRSEGGFGARTNDDPEFLAPKDTDYGSEPLPYPPY
ncbi:Ca2+ regulator and membrane fusion protein Fig1-domain-containing protein [Apiospora arundinis]|uniref:Ca2+ regulator and membrane fusion protein Fig1-domain-containing protein n=1 Tax=Apiospora arundinis TaxID=335852 RepID=A0ABR2I8C0_9PEZI